MKKTAFILAVVIMISLFSACGGSGAKDPGFETVANGISAASGLSGLIEVDANYIANMLKLGEGDYAECKVMLSNTGTSIDEYGVFRGSDEEQAKAIETALNDYLQFRLSVWMEEYLPEELPKLQNAKVTAEGCYVMYAIVSDSVRAQVDSAFADCFR